MRRGRDITQGRRREAFGTLIGVPLLQPTATSEAAPVRRWLVVAWLLGGAVVVAAVPQLRLQYSNVWHQQSLQPIAIAGGAATVALMLDRIALGSERSAIRLLGRPGTSARHDLANAAIKITGLTWIPLAIATFGVFPLGVAVLAKGFRLGTDGPLASLGSVSALIVAVVLGDFFNYWYHRFMHRLRFAWQLHEYHHGATEFTILTGSRVHLGEVIFNGLLVSVPLLALGVRFDTIVWFAVIRRIVSWLHHSMADWTFGWIGTWVLYSPIGHRIHHSELEEHWDKNFGNLFTWWDHLFGTYYHGSVVNDTVGVTDDPLIDTGVVEGFAGCLRRSATIMHNSATTGRWLMPDWTGTAGGLDP